MEEKAVNDSPSSPPWGVSIFSGLLIFSSLMHVQKLILEYNVYVELYRHLPYWLLMLRYSFSWLQRILGLTAAFGMLRLKDFARKLAIGIGCFTISTIYWKHPYIGFMHHTDYLDRHFGFLLKELGYPQLRFSDFTLAAVIAACVWDILFFSIMIYYLTRPKVKACFKARASLSEDQKCRV